MSDPELSGLGPTGTLGEMLGPTMRLAAPRRRSVVRCAGAALCALALVATTSCIPSQRGDAEELDDGSDSVIVERTPPAFPEEGVVPVDLLVEGLVFDLTNAPSEADFWTPPTDQATCAAEAIVEGLGDDRLSELGYRPGVDGASLNDLALGGDERTLVVDAFESCVDMVEGVASMLYGDGRLVSRAAVCVAEGLDEKDLLRPFVNAWAFGDAVDPFASDGALAAALLDESVVCVPGQAFNWFDLRFPDEDRVLDSDVGGGKPNSPFVDDQPTTTGPDGP